MNIEEIVRKTLADHEHLTPEEGPVRAGIDARLAAGRRPNTRLLAVAASVAVVAAAATGTALFVAHRPSHRPSAHPASCSNSVASTSIAPQTLPFELGYLPRGRITWQQRSLTQLPGSAPRVSGGGYVLDVGPYFIQAEQVPTSLGSVAHDRGITPVTIDGRRGYEGVHGGSTPRYEVLFADARGGVMMVAVSPQSASGSHALAELTALGRRIARAVTFATPGTVPTAFGFGSLPAGYRVAEYLVQGGTSQCSTDPGTATSSSTYELRSSGGSSRTITVGMGVDVRTPKTAGRPVQNRQTYYEDIAGRRTLRVVDAVHGHAVTLTSTTASKAVLYRVADQLTLPSR